MIAEHREHSVFCLQRRQFSAIMAEFVLQHILQVSGKDHSVGIKRVDGLRSAFENHRLYSTGVEVGELHCPVSVDSRRKIDEIETDMSDSELADTYSGTVVENVLRETHEHYANEVAPVAPKREQPPQKKPDG